MFIVFDTETTGLPKDWNAPITDLENWPRMVQIAWQIHSLDGSLIESNNFIIKPEGYEIPFNSVKIHGITNEKASSQGEDLLKVLTIFKESLNKCSYIIGHNIEFDCNIVGSEFLRKKIGLNIFSYKLIDTKNESVDYCKLAGGRGGKFKWPTLSELHYKLFDRYFDEAHNASADVEATANCFLELLNLGVIDYKSLMSDSEYLSFQENYNGIKSKFKKNIDSTIQVETESENVNISDPLESSINIDSSSFSHLHVHTQYSILQGTTNVHDLVNMSVKCKMPAVAITDKSNMFGSFKFIETVLNHPVNMDKTMSDLSLKPIVGCEINVCDDMYNKSVKDNGGEQVFLCKNINGFRNLSKLCSLSYIDGFYYVPRIDKKLLIEYKDNLIALTGSIYGEIPSLILNYGESKAEESFKWWHENFGDDFYVEINKHGIEEENHVNDILIKFANKYGVKIIASNNVYYLNKNDANSHDILLCVKDNQIQSTPKGKGRGSRYALPNDEYYFKSQMEMGILFKDIPEAILNINDLIQSVESFSLNRDVLLPAFDIPEDFVNDLDKKDNGKRGENKYLKHLTYLGAKERYGSLSDSIKDRIDFELSTISQSGYPGYFLIVQDLIAQARKMNVSVGPGRGSAAGSVVAYCTGITNVDPIKYDLLFERFLNPERISLPDIDIDFDDEGRSRVIDWVVHKYGFDQVSQIITYGTMAAKSSIRDTARVLDLPLITADKLAKMVPDMTSLKKLFSYDSKQLKEKINVDQISNAKKLIEFSKGEDLSSDTINLARMIEGSIRNIGTHACGVIITPEPLLDLIPMASSKESDLMLTQYDNSSVESAGLLKMDFLGLSNLTIIKDCIKIIKQLHAIDIDIDTIPLDDSKTYEVFQRGDTVGIFQFSSLGMRKHLKVLRPDKFEDLIAMNALYRPGPMGYIPEYISRKHGKSKVIYDLPEMEEYLSDTYGITVYQEQVMLLSQKLGNFTKGEADILRKGMGKKDKPLIAKLKPKFFDGCEKNGLDLKVIEKIWTDWEKFTEYAFNKSHSTCYSLIAYQTAYLKAHYPAELMAAILTSNMSNMKKVTVDMEECKRMAVSVLSPDVNESFYKFAVNKKGEIRFGLGAVKGVGEAAVHSIVSERKLNGAYKSLENFMSRIDFKSVNKKTLESIALSGGFDSFNIKRSQLLEKVNDNFTYLDLISSFGKRYQKEKDSPQITIFSEKSEPDIIFPLQPDIKEWDTMTMLSKEKEVVGVYVSGHPLDDYGLEIKTLCNTNLSILRDLEKNRGKTVNIGVVVTGVEHRESQNGNKYAIVTLEDYTDNYRMSLFGNDYLNNKNYLEEGWILYISGKIQERKWKSSSSSEYEFKVQTICVLADLINSENRKVYINLNVDIIDNTLVNSLIKMIEENSGQHTLFVKLQDFNNKYSVDLLSRKYKIKLDNNMFDLLNNINGVELVIE